MAALDATISRLEDQLKKAKARRQKNGLKKTCCRGKKRRGHRTPDEKF